MSAEKRIIFVVGNPRSGTTMLGRILGNHPEIHTFEELHFFEKVWGEKNMRQRLSEAEALRLVVKLIRSEYRRDKWKQFTVGMEVFGTHIIEEMTDRPLTPLDVYESFLRYVSRHHGKTIPCKQTPAYVYYLPEILEAFPEARIINIVRDPRDVLLSQKRKWKQRFLGGKYRSVSWCLFKWANYHPVSTSLKWRAAAHKALAESGNRRVCSVRFEDILDYPEREIEKLCRFAGVTYQEIMLDVPVIGSSFLPDRADIRGIDKTRKENWKGGGLNSSELWICQRLLGGLMKQWGYESIPIVPNMMRVLLHAVTCPLKLAAASLFLFSKMRNRGKAVRRRLKSL